MTNRLLLLLALTLPAACASKHELAKCGGPIVALNPTRWTPTSAQTAEMERIMKEACK